MDDKNHGVSLKKRIQSGSVTKSDVARRLAELAFGKANDCVKLAFLQDPALEKLDFTLLSELKRSEKGVIEVKLIDRLKALEALAALAEGENTDLINFLEALQQEAVN